MGELKDIRTKINQLDSDLISLLAERRKLSKEIVIAKDSTEHAIRDKDRETELLKRLIQLGKEKGIDAHFLTKVFYEIIEDSVRIQLNHVQNLTGKKESGKRVYFCCNTRN
jgi:chorismate mutase/prephenate dehydratase